MSRVLCPRVRLGSFIRARGSVTTLCVLACLTDAPTAAAQGDTNETRTRDIAVDLAVAYVSGRSAGRFVPIEGFGASAVAMTRVRALSRGALVAGVAGDISGATSATADCVPFSPCRPSVPAVVTLGVLAGWELRRRRNGATLRGTVGPVLMMPVNYAKTAGLQARIDVATPSLLHVALSAFAQHIAGAGVDGLRLSSVGVGLRFRFAR